MGRPPKPQSLHEASGAWEKNPNRRRTEEPIPPDGELEKPKYLKAAASKVWDRIAPICFGMGTAKHGDEDHLARYCVQQAEFEKDPARFCEIASKIQQLRTDAERLGIAGAGSRAKLGVKGGGKDEPKDPAEDFFTTSRSSNTVRQ
jgi:hypothetical protein